MSVNCESCGIYLNEGDDGPFTTHCPYCGGLIKKPKIKAIPVELPIYKIKGKYYFRDDRLNEYRNICNPNDKKPLDSVLETPTHEDSEKIYGKCNKNPCNLKIKGKREELK